MRFDIAFFLCCCRSFLSSSGRDDSESFYDLLGVEPDASSDELKRAYKRQSLQMHPDKLAQKGQTVTAADRDRFTRMRHAYEVLSDPRRRETYDAIGEQGMKWVEEPLSVDPQELAHNFATSSIMDRSKIFGIFLAIYIAVFVLPVLVCLMADGSLGNAKWVAVLAPLWVWDFFILFYQSRVIMMGPIKRPDHVPEEEWIDPLPMAKRIMSMVRFGLLVLFEVLLALRLDGTIHIPWTFVFIPIYFWEIIALRRKIHLINMTIVTHDELELAIGKKLTNFSPTEREDIHRRFIIVPSKSGPVYEAARRLQLEAKGDIIRISARILFTVLLVTNLDTGFDWSWWIVFLPILGMAVCIVGTAFQNFSEIQTEVAKRDSSIFGMTEAEHNGEQQGTPYATMDENNKTSAEQSEPLTNEEKEELKAKLMQSATRAVATCFSQCFFIFLVCLLIGKIEGAGYSSLVIISPFLLCGGVILCCLACTIFCISEVDENAGMADFDSAVNQAAATAAAGYGSTDAAPSSSTSYVPPAQVQQSTAPKIDGASISTWDPERGQVWEGGQDDINQVDTISETRDEPPVDTLLPPLKEQAYVNPEAVNDSYDLD
mmetsp:Transcript_19077/g.39952  ORF Transcript_19077/g.39952 Transcript_19077/m.39952 type:complete len:601 (-) Transcript_19077:268-2070(-)